MLGVLEEGGVGGGRVEGLGCDGFGESIANGSCLKFLCNVGDFANDVGVGSRG